MCGYDPFQYYDDMLEREDEAFRHGYSSWEEYKQAQADDIGNEQYEKWKERM